MRGEKRVRGGECGEEKEGETAVEAGWGEVSKQSVVPLFN